MRRIKLNAPAIGADMKAVSMLVISAILPKRSCIPKSKKPVVVSMEAVIKSKPLSNLNFIQAIVVGKNHDMVNPHSVKRRGYRNPKIENVNERACEMKRCENNEPLNVTKEKRILPIASPRKKRKR